MLCDIGTNLLSDVIFSLLVFIFFYVIFLLTKRRKLLRFFGIEKTKKLTIFTSNLIVEKFGSLGNDGYRYSYQGTAIPNEESKAASRLQTLFNYFLPSQIDKPGFVSKLLISDVDVKIFPSPVQENTIEQNASIISIGLPPYNLISRFVESSLNPHARLDYIKPTETDLHPDGNSNKSQRLIPSDNSAGTAVPSGIAITSGSIVPSGVALTSGSVVPSGIAGVTNTSSYTGDTSASSVRESEGNEERPLQPVIRVQDVPPFADTCIGFVQKIFDSKNNRFFFYVAGLSENSTAGSAYYLASNWEDLNKTYGSDTAFCVLLKVSNTNNRISQIILKS
ncbi:MAG: hypothetical protein ABFD05_06810 [Anaerolineaceae bacterium]